MENDYIANIGNIAHMIVNENDGDIIQTVREHSLNTAAYAREKLADIGLGNTAYLTGLIHDMGKCTLRFSDYIFRSAHNEKVERGSVIHTFTGVVYLMERYHKGKCCDYSTLTCEIIAYAIGGHHGEFDCESLNGENGFTYRMDKDRTELCYDEAVRNFFKNCADETEIERLFALAVAEIQAFVDGMKNMLMSFGDLKNKNKHLAFLRGMTARLLLSALVDGDRRDTAEFMSSEHFNFIKLDDELRTKLISDFDAENSKLNDDTPINKARRFFSDRCRKFSATHGSGIYRLNLPTGAGKTISTLRYALTNAEVFKKKRLIFVIPLLSILDQNSKVIRKYINDKSLITEHHSNVVKEFDSPEELSRYELLTQNWESPVIVTTLVQLLNTLFSGKMSCVRRMSALTDSVLVIDEIQTLPKKTMSMFAMAANFLAYSCGATVVLSSATQPCFDKMKSPLRFAEECDIVPFDKEIFAVFERTRVIDMTDPYGKTADELADFAVEKSEKSKSTLIICNTKSTALDLYTQMKLRSDDSEVYHLSASMCMQHRRDVLKKINEALQSKRKLIVVATQLVEAGVDFSFEKVIRVIAGMDNVAQAAGRCNRNGDFDKICDVYVANLKSDAENLKMLKEIKTAQRCTSGFFAEYSKDKSRFRDNLLSNESIDRYYSLLFEDEDTKKLMDYPEKNELGTPLTLYGLLSDNKMSLESAKSGERYLLNQAFKTASEYFKVFDEQTTDIIVPYNEEAEKLIADLNSAKAEHDIIFVKETLEKAKPYIIRIYEYQKQKLHDDGMLEEKSYFIALVKLRYNSETGLYDKDSFC